MAPAILCVGRGPSAPVQGKEDNLSWLGLVRCLGLLAEVESVIRSTSWLHRSELAESSLVCFFLLEKIVLYGDEGLSVWPARSAGGGAGTMRAG
jgi:hypothetical protein